MQAGIEGDGAQSLCRDAIAVSFRNTLGEAVEAQPAQVVGDLSRAQLAGLFPSSGARCSRTSLVANMPWTRRNSSRTCKEPARADR
jgi:hypothetical protein